MRNRASAASSDGYVRGVPNALPRRAASTSGSGAATGESHTTAPASRSEWRAAVAMVTNPPMLWPTTTGGPSTPPAAATAMTSSVQVVSEYPSR